MLDGWAGIGRRPWRLDDPVSSTEKVRGGKEVLSWGICLYIYIYMRGPPRTRPHHVDGVVHWYLWPAPYGTVVLLPPLCMRNVIMWEQDPFLQKRMEPLLGQTAKRFHPPTSWVSTLARRWEWVWTCKNVEKRTQLCPVLLEPNWSWTRSDKMRGEMVEIGFEPWVGHPTGRASSPQGLPQDAESLAVGLPCAAVLYACGNGTAPARLQQHKQHEQDKAPSNPDGARGREPGVGTELRTMWVP